VKEDRTEKATPRKRKESRKEGQVARTQELGAWITVAVLALALPWLLEREMDALVLQMSGALRSIEDPDLSTASAVLRTGAQHAFVATVLLGGVVLLVTVLTTVAQGGLYVATKAAKPSLRKLSPKQGLKRMIGLEAWWNAVKMLLKSAVVAVFVHQAVVELMPLLGGMVPVDAVLGATGDTVMGLLRAVAAAGIVMAGMDYAVQRVRTERQLRMTKEEVKTEHKQAEGDPLVKSAIRGRQLAAARQRMMADVEQADVVLVNPTHVAVALRYDADRGAPRVVARGTGEVAARIRDRAAEHGVPLVRDVALARALHRSTQVGQEVPVVLFEAVAQVLAWVMSRSGPWGPAPRRPSRPTPSATVHTSPRPPGPLPAVPRRAPSGRALTGR
jgi:flagellar biosynthetic protein FlhB